MPSPSLALLRTLTDERLVELARMDRPPARGRGARVKRGPLVHEATVDRSGPSPVVTAITLVRA